MSEVSPTHAPTPPAPIIRWEVMTMWGIAVASSFVGLVAVSIPGIGDTMLRFANDATPLTQVLLSGIESAQQETVARLRVERGDAAAHAYDVHGRVLLLIWILTTVAQAILLAFLVITGRERNVLERSDEKLEKRLRRFPSWTRHIFVAASILFFVSCYALLLSRPAPGESSQVTTMQYSSFWAILLPLVSANSTSLISMWFCSTKNSQGSR